MIREVGGRCRNSVSPILSAYFLGIVTPRHFRGRASTKADGKALAAFRFNAPQAGTYEIRMTYSAHATRATNVPVVIPSGKHHTTLSVNQTIAVPPGQDFRTVGTVQLAADVETVITVSKANTDGLVTQGALQVVCWRSDLP